MIKYKNLYFPEWTGYHPQQQTPDGFIYVSNGIRTEATHPKWVKQVHVRRREELCPITAEQLSQLVRELATQRKDYLRVEDVAQLCNVSIRTVREWIARGWLRASHIGGSVIIRRQWLEEFIDRFSR